MENEERDQKQKERSETQGKQRRVKNGDTEREEKRGLRGYYIGKIKRAR